MTGQAYPHLTLFKRKNKLVSDKAWILKTLIKLLRPLAARIIQSPVVELCQHFLLGKKHCLMSYKTPVRPYPE